MHDVAVAVEPRRRRGTGAGGSALRTTQGRVGFGLIVALLGVAFLGPFVAPHAPDEFVGAPYLPPGSGAGLLGTDGLGRDVLSRILHGGWTLLVLALIATFLAVATGALVGVVAAYRGGRVGGVLMRTVDILLAFPQLVFVLLIVSMLGTPPWLLVVAVAVAQAPQCARVIYVAAQDICERDFVRAVALWGVPPRKVIARQVLPNLVPALAVETGLRFSFSIVIIAGLNFLGFGVTPPDPSWGVMITENRLGMSSNMWGVVAPALVLALLAVGTNIFADALARTPNGER
jgi:peptide/nickel transport system permease protein